MRKHCEFRAVVRPPCLVVAFAPAVFASSAAQPAAATAGAARTADAAGPPAISKVEPPNWWTNFYSPVMVLLYGENLANASISVDYSGISIPRTQAEPDGKHAFVWLDL